MASIFQTPECAGSVVPYITAHEQIKRKLEFASLNFASLFASMGDEFLLKRA